MRMLQNTRFYCGVDLGQVSDYTAMVILQYDKGNPHYYVRWAERFPLQTSYPAIVDLVSSRMKPIADYLPYLVVDCTGPGLAVTDLMQSRGLELTAVNITGGMEESEGEASLHIPKRQLVGGLAVALQLGKIIIAQRMKDAEALRQELLDFQIRFGRAGHERYEARRAAVHDDLAIALMLAYWKAVRQEERGEIMGLYEYLRRKEQMQGGAI